MSNNGNNQYNNQYNQNPNNQYNNYNPNNQNQQQNGYNPQYQQNNQQYNQQQYYNQQMNNNPNNRFQTNNLGQQMASQKTFMDRHLKKIIGIVVVLVVLIGSITTYKFINKDKEVDFNELSSAGEQISYLWALKYNWLLEEESVKDEELDFFDKYNELYLELYNTEEGTYGIDTEVTEYNNLLIAVALSINEMSESDKAEAGKLLEQNKQEMLAKIPTFKTEIDTHINTLNALVVSNEGEQAAKDSMLKGFQAYKTFLDSYKNYVTNPTQENLSKASELQTNANNTMVEAFILYLGYGVAE